MFSNGIRNNTQISPIYALMITRQKDEFYQTATVTLYTYIKHVKYCWYNTSPGLTQAYTTVSSNSNEIDSGGDKTWKK